MNAKVRGAKHHDKHGRPLAPAAAVFAFFLITLLIGCSARKPILIGFTAELSGRNATLGVQSRNGAELAVEAVNARGGIAGRKLELVVRDNQGSPELVARLDQEMIDGGVFVLSGHNTSWESVAAKPVIDARSAVLVSPSAASPLFDSRDDFFFRLIPSNREQALPMASFAYRELNLRRIAVLHDEDNQAFTQPFARAFLDRFLELGGQKVTALTFSSRGRPNFRSIVEILRASGADGLLVVASDLDTALIAQQVRMAGLDLQIFTSNWAYTGSLIKNGGQAVEGMILPSHFNTSCEASSYQKFREQYRSSFGDEPGFVSALSYETILVIAKALEATGGKQEGFAQALTGVRNFEGLCGKISIDANGDARRSVVLLQIRGSQYRLLKTLTPEESP